MPPRLTTALQRASPVAEHTFPEQPEAIDVARYSVVVEVALHNRSEPGTCLWHRIMHSQAKLLFDFLQLLAHALANSHTSHSVRPLPALPADVREAKEVEGLRFPFPSAFAIRFGIPPEFDSARLVRVKIQSELPQSFSHGLAKTIRIRSPLEPENESSRPGELHPQALTDPDMNVSAHPALIVQPSHGAIKASEQRAVDRAIPLGAPSALPCADVATGVCISPLPSVQDADPDSAASGRVPTCSSDRST